MHHQHHPSGARQLQQLSLSLGWNEQYQLTSAVRGSDSIQYGYDLLGRKVSRTASGSPAEVEYYVYDGDQVVADLNADREIIRSYTWGPGIDNLLTFTDHASSNTYYAIKDHQNTVLAFVDADGAVIESYDYDAWGRTTVYNSAGEELSESAIGNRYTFQGREIDWATGLYYFRARWYNPISGRWLSKDPIGIAGGLNLYAAFGNNPVNFIDPLGLFCPRSAIKGAAGATSTGGVVANGEAAIVSGSILTPTAALGQLELQYLDELMKPLKDQDRDKIKDLEKKMADLRELIRKMTDAVIGDGDDT